MTIVVFGSTGDLYHKKLARTFFDLSTQNNLGGARVIGFGRKNLSDEEFRIHTKKALEAGGVDIKKDKEKVNSFLALLSYIQGNIDSVGDYKRLADRIRGDRLFYLAVPPTLYEDIFKNLFLSGLMSPRSKNIHKSTHWTRLLVEKPFGNDIKHAEALEALLGEFFNDDDVFRVDHYLAKEAMQNILAFRFANAFLENAWDHRSVEKVELRFLEKHIVGDRGAFYDKIGALKDVGGNHMLQMLALIAMEDPRTPGGSGGFEKAREKVLESLKISKTDKAIFTRKQYDGYISEKGVAPDSKTETYFKITLEVNNKRWKGVPFILESGKGLAEAHVDIKVFFKSADPKHRNILTFSLTPHDDISMTFLSKKPGFGDGLEERVFRFTEKSTVRIPDAYERIMYDAIKGDRTLFPTAKEVRSQWNIITKVLRLFKRLPLETYPIGGVVS